MTKFCRDRQIAKINTIQSAMHRIEDYPRRASREQTAALLAELQQTAIEIGAVLEQDLGEVSLLIRKLEEFCETLYQISVFLDERKRLRAMQAKAQKILRDLIEALAAVRPRKEIVFFPYQVSMWDSLESVWLAARDDETADAYVVPIPFYDVLPDHTLGTLHDQGAEYPAYVPVTPYEDYSLEERRPDVIFIHNPYDGCNSVTRVPERYYASKLRNLTEKLVYIPYFASEGSPSEHHCYTPGVLFSDRVIVQPGSVYESYCRVYTRVINENGWAGAMAPAEKKFLPLGSPKFDKLLNTSCDFQDLPKSWRQAIGKSKSASCSPKEGKKRIVLYNLTIAVMLSGKEQVLKKAERVLKLFKEKKDEAVLLWRPHPLLLSAIDSMRPQLREEYLRLVKQFREEGWGIFDETPDPNLAMALSDAYYGDWSSLMVTYRATGKPIEIQNPYGDEEEEFLLRILEEKDRSFDEKADAAKDGAEGIGSRVYRTIMSEGKS